MWRFCFNYLILLIFLSERNLRPLVSRRSDLSPTDAYSQAFEGNQTLILGTRGPGGLSLWEGAVRSHQVRVGIRGPSTRTACALWYRSLRRQSLLRGQFGGAAAF